MFKDGDHLNPPSSQGSGSDGQGAETGAAVSGTNGPRTPSISLLKGGGAIKGIGEKFAANPVTGTGSLTVPLAISPGRSGFAPGLTLSYDSGAGNGPFGFGWNLSLPVITRKTDKGLPRYNDAEESDVFILSGAEDLVPVLQPDGSRVADDASAPGYTIHPYRPRIEGTFARIERWTRHADGEVHWRSLTKDNLLTLYGQSGAARVADPQDAGRIFSWLICETRDDKGNAVVYEYKREDAVNVDLTQAHERNRGDKDSLERKADLHIKNIRYGNRVPLLDAQGNRPQTVTQASLDNAGWMFEVVFDYGEGHYQDIPLNLAIPPSEQNQLATASLAGLGDWPVRRDPFSLYRAGFEVRNYRLCRRVLMFHHFPAELKTDDCLVRATEFTYAESPVASFVTAVTQSGYVRRPDGNYLKKSMPPLEFAYSEASIQSEVGELNADSLQNLPAGLDGLSYRWVDLDGEGVSGILTEQAGAWFYKPNLGEGRFGSLEVVAPRPSLANLSGGRQQLLDLSGDGQLDVVSLAGPTPGFYERTQDEGWEDFKPFASLPNVRWDDPNLRFVDLNGDGHADALLTEHEVFTWLPSLAEDGFGPARRVYQPLNAEDGPRLAFADGEQSIYLADMCGDGLADLVRVRNGEVCYWPNRGYGRFGAQVVMDNSPWLDNPDQFNQKRVRLADIDGSGANDLIYLHPDGVRLYFNQSGNRWSEPRHLRQFPDVDDLSSVVALDLLGNGTACLVWSSSLPAHARRQVRYVDLMGGRKPHLLVKSVNNLGAEISIRYAPSTKFYLEDKAAGTPWITRLPFPVHVVERVETFDYVSRSLFVTSYKYHHGYFDGVEREFRGFGMVEQWDTAETAALSLSDEFPGGANIDAASHVPPTHTKTWFHTGLYVERDHVSDFFAGTLDGSDRGEYYREPAWSDDDVEARKGLLDDTALPAGLTLDEEREACRALKGSMLRQEIYALDGSDKAGHPYTVAEQNFTVRLLQPRHENRHSVFFTHARESLNYHYERNPSDPRIGHTLTLEVDEFGNVLKEAVVGYGRRATSPALTLTADQDKQTQPLITYTENRVSNALVSAGAEAYRTPLTCETRTYELTGYTLTDPAGRFSLHDFVKPDPGAPARLVHVFDSELAYEAVPTGGKQRRLIEHVRTVYRSNDLTALLPLYTIESLALAGESYKLAFTPGLLAQVYRRDEQPLLPSPAGILGSRGGYLRSQDLKAAGLFPVADPDDYWWVPGGVAFHSPRAGDSAASELAHARQHFFLLRRYRDPFGQTTTITYDAHDLLMLETRDPLGNRVSAGERKADGDLDENRPGNDYRVLQPALITDPNRNRAEVMFDALGLVAGTAVKGKDDTEGDTLAGFAPDLTEAQIDGFYDAADPHDAAPGLLAGATTRIISDPRRFHRTRQAHPEDPKRWLPVYAATLARESHVSDAAGLAVHISFSYADGFAREIQKKIQAEPGPLVEGGASVSPRWVGSGWIIFNNKGKPIRQYEPFFSQLAEKRHQFEYGAEVGVSTTLFYDPPGRVVAKLHPNHTYEKIVFDPWQQTSYDANDTVKLDPSTDEDVKGFFLNPDGTPRLPASVYTPTWHALRTDPAHAVAASQRWPEARLREAEKQAAQKAEAHQQTPTVVHFDTMGRHFLTVTHNKSERMKPGGAVEALEERYATRVYLDIEGNQRMVRDAVEQDGDPLGRIVMRFDYDMLGTRIHQAGMESGGRWKLNDVLGLPIHSWTSRGHAVRTEYDPMRRPLRSFVTGVDPVDPNRDLLVERMIYGEQHPQGELLNLRGKLFLSLDQAGAAGNDAHDFKGNLTRASRRLAREFKKDIDWSAVETALPADALTPFDPVALGAALATLLESETFTSRTYFDALNRPIQMVPPHSDQPGAKLNVIRHVYNAANLLEQVHVWLEHPAEPAGLLDAATTPPSPAGVNNIDYDAKGQRRRIEYKNGAVTRYHHDRETFRLTHLYTRRGAAFDEDCDNPQPPPATTAAPDAQPPNTPCGLQSLRYTYDAVGNITHLRDDARQRIYFAGEVVSPQCEYTYDAVYRLTEATGREHIGQAGQPASTWSDEFRVRRQHPNDAAAMRNYTEVYEYDAAGNFERVIHEAANGGWTRHYTYDEASLLEPAKRNNRLSSTTVGNGVPETYAYDAHGNVTRLSHLPRMEWDYRDQLHATARQVVNGGVTETTWYVYNNQGQRIRKVTEHQSAGPPPTRMKERIYLGDSEIYREYGSNGATVALERETLHVTDDKQRIALVETRTDPASSARLIRYQLGNHLGSATLELDQQAQIISYEEFYPYGGTSYQAVRSQAETPKRYRYTGKERDEESGLYYHGARYYAPWLGRWTSCDPAGLIDGLCLYWFARDEPTNLVDKTGHQAGPWEPLVRMKRAQDAIAKTFGPAMKEIDSVTDQIVEGDLHEGETTWGGVTGNIVVGLIPYVGQAADVRDTFAAGKGVWSDPTSWGKWGGLAMAGVGWVPLIGDAAKGVGKVGKKALKGGTEAAGKVVKEGVEQTLKAEKKVVQAEKAAEKAADAGKVAKEGAADAAKVLNRTEALSLADAALAPLVKQFPDAQVGIRGSLARGSKGPHKGNAPFDPTDFDVDAFIVSDKLAGQVPANAEGFRNLARLPEYGGLVRAVGEQVKSIPGVRPDTFKVRVFSTKEFEAAVKANERHFVK